MNVVRHWNRFPEVVLLPFHKRRWIDHYLRYLGKGYKDTGRNRGESSELLVRSRKN